MEVGTKMVCMNRQFSKESGTDRSQGLPYYMNLQRRQNVQPSRVKNRSFQ